MGVASEFLRSLDIVDKLGMKREMNEKKWENPGEQKMKPWKSENETFCSFLNVFEVRSNYAHEIQTNPQSNTPDTLSMHQMLVKYLLMTRNSFLEVRAPSPSELIFWSHQLWKKRVEKIQTLGIFWIQISTSLSVFFRT
jgi:hypothetical protein